MAGRRTQAILKRDKAVGSPSATREYDFVFERGRDCYVWDADGKRYLDFAAGIAVLSAGHCNPEIMGAVKQQLARGSHCGFYDFCAEAPVAFMEKLVSLLPEGLDEAFLANSGTETVEAAFKLARYHTKRRLTVAFENCFHGRTMGSLSMTQSKPVQREGFGPFLPVHHIPYPYTYRSGHDDPESCSRACLQIADSYFRHHRDQIAALFVEPIQGEGGYVVPPRGFLPGLKKLCREHGVIFVADEIQTGCYRTGTFLACEQFGVTPDVVCLAKAIGGGYPIGAMVAGRKMMDWPPGSHANTFGGNLVACAAGLANLRFLERKRAGENARKLGKVLLERLEEFKEKHRIVGDVRGLGLMAGMELVKDRKSRRPAVKERDRLLLMCRDSGLILLPAGASVIRFCPPLIITRKQLLDGLGTLEKCLGKV
jgi:4-aminobutyrate aminotransferase